MKTVLNILAALLIASGCCAQTTIVNDSVYCGIIPREFFHTLDNIHFDSCHFRYSRAYTIRVNATYRHRCDERSVIFETDIERQDYCDKLSGLFLCGVHAPIDFRYNAFVHDSIGVISEKNQYCLFDPRRGIKMAYSLAQISHDKPFYMSYSFIITNVRPDDGLVIDAKRTGDITDVLFADSGYVYDSERVWINDTAYNKAARVHQPRRVAIETEPDDVSAGCHVIDKYLLIGNTLGGSQIKRGVIEDNEFAQLILDRQAPKNTVYVIPVVSIYGIFWRHALVRKKFPAMIVSRQVR